MKKILRTLLVVFLLMGGFEALAQKVDSFSNLNTVWAVQDKDLPGQNTDYPGKIP